MNNQIKDKYLVQYKTLSENPLTLFLQYSKIKMWVRFNIHSLSKGTPWDLLPTYKITLKREIETVL